MVGRGELRADCARCAGLCCVAPAFAASADFAVDKPAGQPCLHLMGDFRCGIHDSLRERGFPGCVVFDCFGAGQQATQVTFGGRDWRADPEIAGALFAVFPVLRQLHELLWYLSEALDLTEALDPPSAAPLRGELGQARERTERLTAAGPDELTALDLAGHRQEHGALLRRVSELVRAGYAAPDHSGADLIGAKLPGAVLRGACLRGAYLIGADLRDADLRVADLLGADLRAADLRGANLADALFVTRPQLDAARGDATTNLPAALTRPRHWTATRPTARRADRGTGRRSTRP